MNKHNKVSDLVKQTYSSSEQDFGKWVWENHVSIVSKFTEDLATKFNADIDLAVAGAWLHDFGDAIVHRHSDEHEKISNKKATEVLKKSGYSDSEIDAIVNTIIHRSLVPASSYNY